MTTRLSIHQSPLDLESLRCFVVAADRRSFRAAARIVALSPAAFSDRIKRLEQELGSLLFDRGPRFVELTLHGERLLPRAKACLDAAEGCRSAMLGAERAPYDLVLGTRYELGLSWLVPLLGSLEERHPERRIHLQFGDTAALLSALRRDELDGFVTSARLATPGLSYARLHEERYVFVGSRRLLAERPLSRWEQSRHHTLLELSPDLPLFRYFLDARPGKEEWTFDAVRHLGTIGAVKARVLAGAGVAVLPEYFVRRELAQGKLTRLLHRVTMPVDWFRLVWRDNHPREAEFRELAGDLADAPLR